MYNKHGSRALDTAKIGAEVDRLMLDDEVTSKKGIYQYVLDGKEKHLNLRAFAPSVKRSVYKRRGGVYPVCGNHYDINEMEGDHIKPWHLGGKTTADNCQMLCRDCNRTKSGK